MRPEIGILTWHQYYNFGSMLQAYALQTTLRELGIQSELIDYYDLKTMPPPGKREKTKFFIKKMLAALNLQRLIGNYYSFQRFYYKRLQKSKTITSREELQQLSSRYRCIICGSDQIWAPNVYDPVYMADFADEKTVKLISYAASIGLNDIPVELQATYSRLLSRFSKVSVREEIGKRLLKEQCGIESEVVLDPTLLLKAEDYRKIEKAIDGIKEPYVFCYFLNKDHRYRERVEKYASEHGYKIYGVSACGRDKEWMQLLPQAGPEEFLWLVDHAATVFTDSYHGTIFSLQFHKNFWTFERFTKDDPICQNSRIQQLDRFFGVGIKFLALDADVDDSTTIDYRLIDEKLQFNRERSKAFLRKELL